MDNSEDVIFDFDSPDFIVAENEKEKIISNEQHYNLISEISNNFFKTLDKNDIFNHKESWNKFSTLEPIKFIINTVETYPGIIDISFIRKSFISKVLIALCADIYELKNNLPNLDISPFESLNILSLYGEKLEEEDIMNLKPGESEKNISLLLPYLNQIYDKITKLLSIVINLCNQILAIYDKKNDKYKGLQYINLRLPFKYIGLIFSYFLAIDTIIKKNTTLTDNWDKYKLLIFNVNKNPSQYNINQDQLKQIEKLCNKYSGPIFGKKCYEGCIRNFIKNVGNFSPSESGKERVQDNPIFFKQFTDYLSEKNKELYEKYNKDNNNLNIEVFQLIALFGLYYKIYSEKNDKTVKNEIDLLYIEIWKFVKKVSFITIIGNTIFDIDGFLMNFFSEFQQKKKLDPKPKEIQNIKINLLKEISKKFNDNIKNLKSEAIMWVNEIESIIDNKNSNNDLNISEEEYIKKNMKQIEKIEYGINLSKNLNNKIKYILEGHVYLDENLSVSLIYSITTGLELIKVIQSEYNKLMPLIAQNLTTENRVLLSKIQAIVKEKIEFSNDKIKSNSKKLYYYNFMKDISRIFNYNCEATPSHLRRVVYKLCFEMMLNKETKIYSIEEINEINLYLNKLDLLNNLTEEINCSCDTSFLYFYPSIIEISLENIFNEYPKRIYFFAMAVNEMEKPLNYIKFLDNNEMLLKQRKIIKEKFEQYFLNKISRDIEIDLRKQIHSLLIKALNIQEATEKNFSNYLTIENFQLFDEIINVKRYIEEYFNITFYKMTTLNINDWKTYQQMRNLAKSKYNLNLHEIFLPSQSLEQGKDILDIIRNFVPFVKKYNHNMHNQNFIEISNDSANINIIGINQILYSIYTHGSGIVNSIINKCFQFISKLIQKLIAVISDEYINSVLREERDFWNENKNEINFNYPLEKAEQTRFKIKAVSEDYKVGFIEQLIKVITQIGNGIGLARIIRSALMEYNSQNVNLITTSNIENFKKLSSEIELNLNNNINDPTNQNNNNNNISQNMLSNTQSSLNETNKSFCETVNNLKETGDNNINYLNILVNAFGDALTPEKIKDIELFVFLFPSITITFIEKLIVAKDNIQKKNKEEGEAFFSDDGFIIGICYLLKVFRIDHLFDSLNWFTSVISYYQKQHNNYNNRKEKKKFSDTQDMEFNISERKVATYLKQFENLYYTYTAASVLFNE